MKFKETSYQLEHGIDALGVHLIFWQGFTMPWYRPDIYNKRSLYPESDYITIKLRYTA